MAKFLKLGDKTLYFSRPLVMGILNVTDDSFYDGGRYTSEKALIERIHKIVEDGGDIIDVGAYSTRPGAETVSAEEEILRLSWAVELIRKYFPAIPVSVDTFRADVAKEVFTCMGPVIINDISEGTMTEGMFDFVASTGLPYILMHIQGEPHTMQQSPRYGNVVEEVRAFLSERIKELNRKGFDNIVLDPGFGFGKTLEHNYILMRELERFKRMGYPVLVGISRKSMIYKLIGGRPQDALNGTTVLNTVALLKGADILRVHDVKEAVEAVKICRKLIPEV